MGKLHVALFLLAITAVCAAGQGVQWPPTFVRSKIAVTAGGWHATTRGTIRLVFPHKGKWLIFRGRPDTYHFSADGRTWTGTEAKQAARSHRLFGDTIYTFYSELVEPAPKWTFEKFVCKGTIAADTIRWDAPAKLTTNVSYYPDLHRDSRGHFTMTGRNAMRNEQHKVVGTEVLWKRTTRPNDVTAWGPDVRCIHHTGDADPSDRGAWKRIGSTAHENLVLEDGRSCVIAMMTSGGRGLLLANIHDGAKWGEKDIVLAENMSTWAGTDRRMCAVFDAAAKRIHLAYVDAAGGLWYRTAKPPYAAENWSTPAKLHAFRTFTAVLSLDTSKQPAQLYCLFGKTLFEDRRDLRNTYGSLHLKRLVGRTWNEPVLVSEPDTADNWYPNMNEDCRHGVGILYLRGSSRTRKGKKPPLDIRFTCTGPPGQADG